MSGSAALACPASPATPLNNLFLEETTLLPSPKLKGVDHFAGEAVEGAE